MFVVLNVQPLDFEIVGDRLPDVGIAAAVIGTRMIGYLPVFQNKDDALKEFPYAELAEVKEKTKEDKSAQTV